MFPEESAKSGKDLKRQADNKRNMKDLLKEHQNHNKPFKRKQLWHGLTLLGMEIRNLMEDPNLYVPTKYHAVIVCDEKLVRVPFGDKTLIFHGDGSNNGHESRLNIISCTKAQKYLRGGMSSPPPNIFLAHDYYEMAEDMSKEERLEEVPIVLDFLSIPETCGFTPTRQVECKIDLIPGAAPYLFLTLAELRSCLSKKKEDPLRMCIDYRGIGIANGTVPWSCDDKQGIHVDQPKIKICQRLGISKKCNVVADATEHKGMSNSLAIEARKPENLKSEDVGGMLIENSKRSRKALEEKIWNHVRNGDNVSEHRKLVASLL
ncbi:hypothetical protein Tco_1406947 [Tanacetum coccineum]